MVYFPRATCQYADERIKTADVVKAKMRANTVFVLRVKMKNVNIVNPSAIRYRAMPAL